MPNSKDFNRFSVNPVNIDISRSIFNMDHSIKFSCNVGEVIPFEVTEVLPGDTFEVDTTKVVRLQPLVAPIMDEVIMDVYWFFVPNRLVWNHWINFMGENTESAWTPQTEYNIPLIRIPTGGFNQGTIADYMGVPIKSGATTFISALPFRAYALVCDQWFRSEAIMNPVHVHTDDTTRAGVNTGDQVTDIELGGKPFIACKFFDYYTSALPSPQRGNPVEIPIITGSSYAPVVSVDPSDIGTSHPQSAGRDVRDFHSPLKFSTAKNNSGTYNDNFGASTTQYLVGINNVENSANIGNATWKSQASLTAYNDYGLYPSNLYADMYFADFNSVTVNDLRTAFAIQKYLEKSARYGGRYIEHIKAFFNVDSPDARLQRSEYLGGSRISLNINQVENQSLNTDAPLGHVGGMSVTADSNSDFTKSFTEDGLLIGCAVLRYHHTYSQGLDRMWTRKSVYDFYNPVFANLGEQGIRKDELFLTNDSIANSSVFGYQEIWAEYRYRPNRVAGEMRPTADNSLAMWHLGDKYTSAPTLSPAWLREDKAMLDRALAVTSSVANQCICDFYINMKATRPMPLYSIPGLIDHH